MVNNWIVLLQSGLGRLSLTLGQVCSLPDEGHFAFGSQSKAQKLQCATCQGISVFPKITVQVTKRV